MDLRLKELAYERIFIDPVTHFSDLGALIARELERFLDDHQIDRSRLLGVGIALPAVLSSDASRIVFALTLQVRDASLEGLINSISYPTYVANDSSGGGRAEWFVRCSRRNMACLSLENGVGGAVLGGFLTEYIEPYLPRLKEYAAALNTFEPNAEYLQLSTLRRHTVPLGAALHFVVRVLEGI